MLGHGFFEIAGEFAYWDRDAFLMNVYACIHALVPEGSVNAK